MTPDASSIQEKYTTFGYKKVTNNMNNELKDKIDGFFGGSTEGGTSSSSAALREEILTLSNEDTLEAIIYIVDNKFNLREDDNYTDDRAYEFLDDRRLDPFFRTILETENDDVKTTEGPTS